MTVHHLLTTTGLGTGAGGLIILAGLIALYWAPSLIGGTRHVRHTGPLFAINLLLGWTVLGWIIALVMALWPQAQHQAYAAPQPDAS